MKLSADRKRLEIDISGDFSAAQVEQMLSDLAQLRATMDPPVSPHRPDPNSDARVSEQDEPSITAVPMRDGRIRFWLRNNGLGWLVFNFSHQQAVTLRDFFAANVHSQMGETRLFGAEYSNGDKPH